VGIEISQDQKNKTVTISQKQYIDSILQKEGLENANPVGMPMDPNIKLNPSDTEPDNNGNKAYTSLITYVSCCGHKA